MTLYDDALPRFVALVAERLGTEALQKHLFLRDVSGRLMLVLRGDLSKNHDDLRALSEIARVELHPYVDNMVVATPEQLFDPTLGDPNIGHWARLPDRSVVRLLERWLVGQDWQTPPRSAIPGVPPVVVFASHKGGVGRSTALAVAAVDFAARGHKVLAIDLDLEAPGIGTMLLADEQMPAFGSLDFFVENGMRSLSDDLDFFNDIYGVSPLTHGTGLVHVVPAVGRQCARYPENIIGKIARAYIEDPGPDRPKTFLDQTRDLIAEITALHHYDVVLVDTRAGLHETAAAAILGLGADVLLFGVDTPQTFQGYRFLLAHLARFIDPDNDGWRERLRVVHAKASADPTRWSAFNDRAFDLFQEYLYDQDAGDQDADVQDATGFYPAFNFSLDDVDAPHHAWRILNDNNFAEFAPFARPDLLAEPVYGRTYGSFLDALRERINLAHDIES